MVNKRFWLGMLIMAFAFCLVFSNCANNESVKKISLGAVVPSLNRRPISIEKIRDYNILGSVSLEKHWFGILGFSIRGLGIDAYVFQNGGITYADLLTEAKKNYPNANAVIDITMDYEGSTWAIFFAHRKTIVTGIAIEFINEHK